MDRDSRAFAGLFRAHYSAVCRYIAARADADAVEDVAADTFMVAWRRRDELPDQPRPWLLATAAKCLANHRRSSMRSARVSEHLVNQPAPVSASVEEALVRAEQGRALFAALTALRDGDRELLLLHHWDGLAARDIAALLGCSRIVARARLHRAGRRLQEALDAALDAEPEQPRTINLEPTT